MQVLEQVLLAPYTTFGIGGPARWFVEASTEDEVLEAVRFAQERNAPLFVLGGGSNLLVSDAGFPGVVLRISRTAELTSDSVGRRVQSPKYRFKSA